MSFYPSSYTVEHFHADDGTLLSGGTLSYYIAGTTTPVTVYTDSAGTEAGATITLNARGEPEVSGNTIIIWLSASVDYKVIGKNASGGIEWTIDNLTSSSAGNTNTAVAQADYIQWPYITVNGSDTDHDIDFSAGRVADSTAASMLILESVMTKQIDSSWTVGNNAGGLFSGTVANSTTYYCFLIQKDADETIDCGFDTSSTAANIPSGYTKYRRIASLATDGSANIDSTSIVPLLSAEVAKRGEANGTCELDADSLVPVARLPASVAYDSDISGLQTQITNNDTDISTLTSSKPSRATTANATLVWTGSATSVPTGSITGGLIAGTYFIQFSGATTGIYAFTVPSTSSNSRLVFWSNGDVVAKTLTTYELLYSSASTNFQTFRTVADLVANTVSLTYATLTFTNIWRL